MSLHQKKGFSMRKMMIIALAAVAVTAWSSTDSIAQDYQNSYRFGVGLGYGTQYGGGYHNGFNRFGRRGNFNRGLGFGLGTIGVVDRVEAPPYFAQYPPVYYNGIVARPYGISPYAAPPGILPTEMTIPTVVEPQAIHNPYFDQPVAPVSEQPQQPAAKATDNKTTHVVNPYMESYTQN
jgi:hypothetical protein